MITIEKLKSFGANTDEGLARCMNNEEFYLRMVDKLLTDSTFERLEKAVCSGDMNEAFEAAHALKGVTQNLSLTPIAKPVSEMTELLRAGKEADYNSYLSKILAVRNELANL